MTKYRVVAEHTDGTAGESPLIEASTPQEAEETYHAMGGTLNVISVTPEG